MHKVSAFLGNTDKMIVAVLVLSLGIGVAASPAIGTAQSAGKFRVDNSPVSGSATLFEGSRIETSSSAPRVELQNGSSLQFSPESRATIYGNHAILEQGAGVFEGGVHQISSFEFRARNLLIQAEDQTGSASVQLSGATRVQVAALKGVIHVRNAQGMVVANLVAGAALEFDPQNGAAGTARMSGCLQKKANRFLLTDETTNVTVELRGEGLDKEVGNNVVVNGTMESAGDSHAVNVSSIARAGKGCSGRAGKAAAGAGAGGAVAAGWALSGTTIAILGGVAAAATVGGLAAANKLPGQGDQAATISK